MHINWKLKGTFTRCIGHMQRLSGQATTAIGNVIVNLIVHCQWIKRVHKDLVCMMVLGDDNLSLFKRKPDVSKL